MTRTGRTRLDVDARREQLLRIGAELFGTRGYDDVWIEEIADAAGVSTALLYHYFASKREFFVAVVRAETDRVYELTDPDPSVPPEDALRAGMDAFLDYVEAYPQGFLTVLRGGAGASKEVREIVEHRETRQADRLLQAMTGGEDPPELLRVTVRGWLGFTRTAAASWLDGGKQLERDRLRDLLVQALIGLVGAAQLVDPELELGTPPPVA